MISFNHPAGEEVYPVHALFLQWLIFASVLAAALWISFRQGLAQDLIRTDPTGLSIVIALIFFGGTVHCAIRCLFLSTQLNELGRITANSEVLTFEDGELYLDGGRLKPSLVSGYLAGVFRFEQSASGEGDRQRLSQLDEVLTEKARGTHESGWFFAGLLIKLGLLGTVIGFILMLTSVSGVVSFDPAQVHELFRQMTRGMRVALNTTLVGLLGTMLLGFQYLVLDRGADRLLSNTIHFAECARITRR